MAKETEKDTKAAEAPEPTYEEYVDQQAEADIDSLLGGLGTEEESHGEASEEDEVDQDASDEDSQSEEEAAEEDEEDEEDDADEEEEEDPAAAVNAELAAMKQQMKELQAKLAEAEQAKQEFERNKPLEIGEETFVDEDGAGEIYTAEGQNKLANAVMKKAITMARELMLKELPEQMRPLIYSGVEDKLRAQEFFAKNPDIANLDRSYIKGVAERLAKQNPDWTSGKLFESLPKAIRKELKLGNAKKKVKAKQKGPRPSGTRRQAPSKSDVEKDIEALMDVTSIT